jgi:hypothetical protein
VVPGQAELALHKHKAEHTDLVIDQWPPAHLLDLTVDLSEDRLVRVFGHPPRERELRDLDRGDIAGAVAGLAMESESWVPDVGSLPVVDPRKLDFNQLSEYPRRLITAGIAQPAWWRATSTTIRIPRCGIAPGC